MSRNRRGMATRRALAAIGGCLSIWACLGGGGGGISGSGIVIGPITDMGSIVVNDVDIDVSGANVTLDGVPASADDLRLGMIVTVRGTIDQQARTGTADTVEFDDTLQGPIESIDQAATTIVALGQAVGIDNDTVFDGTSFEELEDGNVIEVSGFVSPGGRISATRVALQAGETDIEVSGIIGDLDSTGETFSVGDLTIDFSSAAFDGPPATALADGQLVEVKSSRGPVGGVLVADEVEIELEGSIGGAEGTEMEIEGTVTSVSSPSDFVVNGVQLVRIVGTTQFSGGDAQDVAVGARLSVDGVLDAATVLIAEEIEFDSDFSSTTSSTSSSTSSTTPSSTMTTVTATSTSSSITMSSSTTTLP